MGLLTVPFRLPLLPLQGVIRLAQIIAEEAERTVNDPATIRHELEQIQEARAAGDISAEEAARLENEIVARLTRVQVSGTAAADNGEG
jgi:hypothetical protein